LTMRTIALELAFLAYACHGSREQMTSEDMQDASYEERKVSQKTSKTTSSSDSLAELEESEANARVGVPTPLQALALLLVASKNPAAAFAPASVRPVTVPGHRHPVNNPDGVRTAKHSAVRMKQNDDIGEEKRVPWDWPRFIKQSSRFIEPPSLFKKNEVARVLTPGNSFGELQFFPLDDVVMGGASASTFDNGSRKWTGEVTSRNSGGFVGIRAKTLSPLDLTATKGVVLKLRPDGKARRFKFVLRDNTDFNGITWTASFTVGRKKGVEFVRIPYGSLIATLFAKTVPDVSIDLTNIVAMQLTLSKFEYDGALNKLFTEGNFEMDVLDVSTY